MYTLHTLAILSVKKKSSSIVYDLKKQRVGLLEPRANGVDLPINVATECCS